MRYLVMILLVVGLECCSIKRPGDDDAKVVSEEVYTITVYSGGREVRVYEGVSLWNAVTASYVSFTVKGTRKRVKVYGDFVIERVE